MSKPGCPVEFVYKHSIILAVSFEKNSVLYLRNYFISKVAVVHPPPEVWEVLRVPELGGFFDFVVCTTQNYHFFIDAHYLVSVCASILRMKESMNIA